MDDTAFICCPAEEAACRCVRGLGHLEPHLCECGGSWEFGPPFRIIRLPRETTLAVRSVPYGHNVRVAP